MNKNTKKVQGKIKNRIALYRRRMGLSQRRVATLIGYRDSSTLSVYESGRSMPSLTIAFRLGIVLRVPVEFLFPDLYESLRHQIRGHEECLDRKDHTPYPSPESV